MEKHDKTRELFSNWTDEEYAAKLEEDKMYELEYEIAVDQMYDSVIRLAGSLAAANPPARQWGILGALSTFLHSTVLEHERGEG